MEWSVKEGDAVLVGDVICEIETDKATVGFEVIEDGYLAKILQPAGDAQLELHTVNQMRNGKLPLTFVSQLR